MSEASRSALLESLSKLKLAERTSDPKQIRTSIAKLETCIHTLVLEIEEFKQALLDEFATTMFQTHTLTPASNPFVV